MATFNFNNEKLSIIDEHGHRVDLSPQEAIALLQWVSDNEELLLRLSQYSFGTENTAKGQIEIYIQQHPHYLDTLKAVIPELQEHPSAAHTLVAPVDAVTQHALEILQVFQIEYKIHPLLEDPDGFAQG